MTKPGVQYPHCEPYCLTMWSCTGCSDSPSARPSTVTISRPANIGRSAMQLLMARQVVLPSASYSTRATVQAPQSPSAHPCLLPVQPCVRRYSSRVVVGASPSIEAERPLIVIENPGIQHGILFSCLIGRQEHERRVKTGSRGVLDQIKEYDIYQ